eukprot:TRINITY_DN8138_c0_g1_i1.p1 TRINITY_DN8138_c0_g1~~TRINITY_DN8138_c0_g1_i1.p1  ORF type:complete len:427 (+),score=67.74 TRINITY_DN8138_c0_g1_i1:54-1334(+)
MAESGAASNVNGSAASAGTVAADAVLDAEEYNKKAQDLEAKLVRMEGRESKEKGLAHFLSQVDSPVMVAPLAHKGLGMVSRRAIEENEVIMTCAPYACVPYEARKTVTCAHCMKDCALATPPPAPTYDPPPVPDAAASTEAAPTEESGTGQDAAAESNTTNSNATLVSAFPMVLCPLCEEVWYCSEECRIEDSLDHDGFECTSLQAFDIPWARDYYGYCDDLITDIRLLIRTASRRRNQLNAGNNEFDEEYGVLISNKACYSEEVLASLRGVVQYANYLLPSEAAMIEDDLLDVYCKHRVNMFGLWGNSGECLGYGVYPKASAYNHSCWPVATFYKNPNLTIPHMDFLTVFPVAEGAEVCISYIDISANLQTRRSTLLDKYFFHCTCERCTWQEKHPDAEDPYQKYWVGKDTAEGSPFEEIPPTSD